MKPSFISDFVSWARAVAKEGEKLQKNSYRNTYIKRNRKYTLDYNPKSYVSICEFRPETPKGKPRAIKRALVLLLNENGAPTELYYSANNRSGKIKIHLDGEDLHRTLAQDETLRLRISGFSQTYAPKQEPSLRAKMRASAVAPKKTEKKHSLWEVQLMNMSRRNH